MVHAKNGNEGWIVDTGAANHLVRDVKLLHNPVSCSDEELTFTSFSGKSSVISTAGDAYLPINASQLIQLRNVLYVQDSNFNLLSVSRLTTDYPFSVIFNPSGFVVKDLETEKEIARGHLINGGDYFWPNVIDSSTPRVGEEIWKNAVRGLLVGYARRLAARLREYLWYNFFDPEGRDGWVVDSGGFTHITNNVKLLHNLRPLPEGEFQTDFAGRRSQATHVGDAYLPSQGDRDIILRGVLLIPEAKWSAISVSKFISDRPSCFEFRSAGFVFKSLDEKNAVIAKGPKIGNWYWWLSKKTSPPKDILGI